MKLIPVEAVPKRRGRHHLQDLIEEFVSGDDKVVNLVIKLLQSPFFAIHAAGNKEANGELLQWNLYLIK